MKHVIAVFVGLAALSLVPSISRAEDESAWEQLQDATSGAQSTGVTFDGGPTPTDAYPYGGDLDIPEPQGFPVDTSTETTGGYDVDTSTGGYDTGGYDWGTSTDTTTDATESYDWGSSTDTGYDTSSDDTGSYDVDTSTGSDDTGSSDTGYDTGSYGEESAD